MTESPIILNEREARRARAALGKIDHALSSKGVLDVAQLALPGDVVEIHRKALAGSRRTIAAMLDAYDRIKNGEYAELTSRWRNEPGVILIIARIARGRSQAELASQIGMREQQIQRYEAERYRSINLQTLKKIAAALGVEVLASVGGDLKSWVSGLAVSKGPEISDSQLKTIISHVRRQNWFDVGQTDEEQNRAVLDYIGDSHARFGSPGLLRTGLRSLDLKDDALLAVWRARILARAEEVTRTVVSSFDQLDLSWLAGFVRLSTFQDGPARAVQMAADRGIIIIVEGQIPGLKLDGAAFLLGGVPVVGLTIRHDRVDNFWYTLLHELGHVFLHYQAGLAAGFFDEDVDDSQSDDLEKEADQFASSILIPLERWRLSTARISRTAPPIEQFAKQLGIHPAIVFGRIRRERGDYRLFADRVGSGLVRNQLISD
jgi:HTH-type transcriptional regulator/antitoxin HigA